MTEALKIACDFCKKDIECPPNMLNTQKHACYECFLKVEDELSEEEIKSMHVDFKNEEFDEFVEKKAIEVAGKAFDIIWKEMRDEIRDMSKKDIAQNMFAAGVSIGVKTFIDAHKEDSENKESL